MTIPNFGGSSYASRPIPIPMFPTLIFRHGILLVLKCGAA